MGPPVRVAARTLGGTRCEVEIASNLTVKHLKLLLAAPSGLPAFQQRLLLGTKELQDSNILAEQGVTEECELTLVNRGPTPDWAQALGLDGEHPSLLREYYTSRGLEEPEWLSSDQAVWGQLEDELKTREDKRKQLKGWSHLIHLERNGAPAATLRVSPGEKLNLSVKGFIHNNQGDTCIHQLVLACDTSLVADLNDGVPGRGRNLNQNVAMQAPEVPGTYMLWRYGDLQYSMRDAKRNFEAKHGKEGELRANGKYPSSFVGWLVVR